MPRHGSKSHFHPHDTARADALAGTPLATFKQRLGAYFVDTLFVLVTYLPANLGLQYFLVERLHFKEDVYHSAHFQAKFDMEQTLHFAWVIWLVLYFGLIVWRTNGWTPGKRLFGIRVVSLTHQKITLWQSIERALGYGASALELGSGFLQYFTAPNHCCVHDRIAETIVVNERAVRKAASDAGVLSSVAQLAADARVEDWQGIAGGTRDSH
jgi:uncharacterized RDD family membrane protein YckC